MPYSSTKPSRGFRLLTAAVLLLATTAPTLAQQFPVVPDRSVIGRIGVGGQSGPSQAIPFANFLPAIIGVQSANRVYAGPSSGTAAIPTFRSLVGADLPAPGASSLGGVQSLTCSASNWFNTLSTSGVLGCSQPNFTDLAGSISAAQIPAGTIVNAAISNTAAIALSKLAAQNTNTTVCNPTGGSAVPVACTQTQITAQINLATTSLPGAAPTLPNDGTKFLNGLGAYAAPPSGGQMILLNTLTASASATLSDTTSLTNAYSSYELVFLNLVPATTGTSCEIQVHGGGAFQTTAYITSYWGGTAGSATPLTGAPTTFIPCSNATGTTNAAPGINGFIRVSTPSTGAVHGWYGTFSIGAGANFVALNVAGSWNNTTVIDGFQVLFNSGNITSGSIKIYGIQ